MAEVLVRRVGLISLLLLLATLVGCQSSPGRSDDDNTGQLGTVRGASPAAVYVDLAIAYLQQRNYVPALQNARKAVMVEPNNPSAHNTLALVHQTLGQDAQAEAEFARAVSLDPNDPFANNAFGSFLCGKKRYAEAQQHFERAIANPLNPQRWVPLTNAGACAANQGDDATAEHYLREALQVNPRFPPALIRMARLSLEKKNYLSARAYLQRYLAVAAPTPESLWLGIQTERQLGDKDQLASYELLLRQRFPDSVEAGYLEDR